jgi:hypothetical protein
MDRIRLKFSYITKQSPEGRRVGGPAAAKDMDGYSRPNQPLAHRSAAAQGADLDLEFSRRHPAGQQVEVLRGTCAVERVDDVEDAVFHKRGS